jgi:hypothetical protein
MKISIEGVRKKNALVDAIYNIKTKSCRTASDEVKQVQQLRAGDYIFSWALPNSPAPVMLRESDVESVCFACVRG